MSDRISCGTLRVPLFRTGIPKPCVNQYVHRFTPSHPILVEPLVHDRGYLIVRFTDHTTFEPGESLLWHIKQRCEEQPVHYAHHVPSLEYVYVTTELIAGNKPRLDSYPTFLGTGVCGVKGDDRNEQEGNTHFCSRPILRTGSLLHGEAVPDHVHQRQNPRSVPGLPRRCVCWWLQRAGDLLQQHLDGRVQRADQ